MRLEIVAEAARLEAATQRFLDGFDRSLSMQNSRIGFGPRIGLIASLMWLRPLYRLAVVQNVHGTVRRSTTSALQAASENERAPKHKPNTSSLLSDISHRRYNCYHTSCYQTSSIVDIIVIRHHCYHCYHTSFLSDIAKISRQFLTQHHQSFKCRRVP